MKRRIYLDTSVISNYSDPRDPFLQKKTQEFWATIDSYEVHISRVVEEEIDVAPPHRRDEMRILIHDIRSLPATAEADALAEQYIAANVFARRHINDALHVAIATVHGLSYVVSWNFGHLVKTKTRHLVNLINVQQGYGMIEIVAPPEL